MFSQHTCDLMKTMEIMDQLALNPKYSTEQQAEFGRCARAVEAALDEPTKANA